ncbi:prephenate dehydratase [Hymenobacter sp. CRA2]|uniref:prephenate dehydratase n=1 Tax=Hymenobacter sp. CRA2 TaxID=1955620 RepID=UPI00098F560B|nr:prephenate dehydratase [Hymenobacter sp. CRA2]OON71038.1 chorismate mutase [Hymenobacter sp. CRA2]
MTQTVAIQGFAGSFHQIAAQHYFGRAVTVYSCATFAEVVRQVASGEAACGLMAIENSIAGSILPNYRLLQQAALQITGEVYLQIRQHLVLLPGQTLADVREVRSHPMALLQCTDFLSRHPHWRLVETEDTALSARHIQEQQLAGVAAIAGELAAQLFGLDIVAPDIHSAADNYTRFLVVERAGHAQLSSEQHNKSSLYFHTAHRRGSLAEVLTRIAACGINLSKLQSFPRPGTTWEYYFHADLEFEQPEDFQQALASLNEVAESVRVLGIYHKGQTY